MGMMYTDMECVKYLPISVFQVRQWMNIVFLFFRDFRAFRGSEVVSVAWTGGREICM